MLGRKQWAAGERPPRGCPNPLGRGGEQRVDAPFPVPPGEGRAGEEGQDIELKLPHKGELRVYSCLQGWLESPGGTGCAPSPGRYLEGSKSGIPNRRAMERPRGRDPPARLQPLPPHPTLCNRPGSAPGAAFGDRRLLERLSRWAALASRAKLITRRQLCLPLSPPGSPGKALPFSFLLWTMLTTTLAPIALLLLLPLHITFSFIRSRVYCTLNNTISASRV